jgi:hypothetical protein
MKETPRSLTITQIPASNITYWLVALLFGALAPTLIAWFIVAPLKGQAIAGGWKPAVMITGLLVNGAWGVGTALLFRWFTRAN